MLQTPGVVVVPPVGMVQPVATVKPEIRPAMTIEDQKRMDWFQNLEPPCFNGDPTTGA